MQAQDYAPASALSFADLAEHRDDTDSAIAALEQSLLQHPDDTVLHERLGRLYARIGNDAMAAHHAAYVARQDVAPRAEIWGRVGAGIARDTNPTAAETSAEIRLFDAASNTFQTIAARAREPDTLATVSLDLGASYQLTDTTVLAADLSVSGEKYFSVDGLDTVSTTLTIGPWLSLEDNTQQGAYLRPYVTGGTATLDGQHYYTSLGAGAEMRVELGGDQNLSLGLTLLQTDYSGSISPDFDANTLDNTALSFTASVFGNGPLQSTYSLTSYAGLVESSSRPESYLFAGLSASAQIPIQPFEQTTGMPLFLHLAGTVDQFSYDDADPILDPTRVRRDFWLGADGALVLSVSDAVDVLFGAKYLRRMSNFAVFESDNLRIYTELGVNF